MNDARRVAITGVGVISAIGNGTRDRGRRGACRVRSRTRVRNRLRVLVGGSFHRSGRQAAALSVEEERPVSRRSFGQPRLESAHGSVPQRAGALLATLADERDSEWKLGGQTLRGVDRVSRLDRRSKTRPLIPSGWLGRMVGLGRSDSFGEEAYSPGSCRGEELASSACDSLIQSQSVVAEPSDFLCRAGLWGIARRAWPCWTHAVAPPGMSSSASISLPLPASIRGNTEPSDSISDGAQYRVPPNVEADS